MIALAFLMLQGGELVYEKRATREETQRASVEATLKELPAVRVGRWKVFEGAGRGVDPDDPRWKDGSAYEDGALHRLTTATTWSRILEAEDALDLTVTIGTQRPWDCWVNGEAVSLATHNSTYLLPSKRLDFRMSLRKGRNRLVVEVRGPSEFFFSISFLSPELRIALDRRLDADFPSPASEQFYYRLETVSLPKGLVLEAGGMGFARDGTLVVCTRRGEIWRAKDGAWSLFASGLHEPLGLWVEDAGDVAVVQRTELTRVRDEDGDGKADRFEPISRGWENVPRSTAYAFGLVKDAEGNFVAASSAHAPPGGKYLGWCFKVTPRGEFVPWASGFRTPNGLGLDAAGELFITDNQGDYVGTSAMYHVQKGKFYGHPHSLASHPELGGRSLSTGELDALRTPAAVQFPHGILGRSPSQPLCDTTGGRFGPFEGQFFVGDQSSCIVTRVALETVGGTVQGAAFPFRTGFQSGNNRLAWAPDGSLWVGQTDRGFGAVGGRPFGLERVAWSGRVPFEIRSMRATASGFDLVFTKPADRGAASDPARYSLQRYRYLYHGTYGSPQVDLSPVPVEGVEVSADGRRVSLRVGRRVEGRIYELHVRDLRAADGAPLLHPEAYYTLTRLP
jgi:hypothetical protein